ncbi:glycosyl hydrolase [Microbacterium gilvum]|uniref:Asl1-like glycosyl hydrolase catalytic domain-containing protein n=1 Tax=Microbacterium gilvum TaxID=1336204 RepID=A0ABP9AAM4_9MICO
MSPRRNRKKIAIITASAVGAVAVLGGGAALALSLTQQPAPVETEAATPTPTETASPSPTPTPTPTPEPVELPVSTPVEGAVDGWTGASPAQIADVGAQTGDAASGETAAYVDAPVVDAPVAALTTTAPVQEGTTYAFSAQVRQLATLPEPVSAAILVGETRIELPELDATWTEVTGEYTAPAGATETTVAIQIDGPVTGLGVDDVILSADGGENVVPNPSFESVTADWGILNNSLVLRQDSAALGVRMGAGDASWTVTRQDGSVAAEGTAALRDGVSSVPLEGVTQGYYTVSVADASGASVSTPVAVVDYEGSRIAPDERIGAITHVDQYWYADAADILSSVGFGSARNDVLWEQNETSPGVYSFSEHYTTEFDKMHAHGIGLLGIVNYGNPLYDGGNPPSSQTALDAYGRYAGAIADRFDVVGLEVFNEFNHERFNTGGCGTAPSCYAPLISAVEANVDESVPVVSGSTANYDSPWFAQLWSQTDALAHSDAMSFHPYNPSYYQQPENVAAAISDANNNMNAGAGSTIPIWITEFGWTTGNELGQARSLDVQAQNVVAAQVVSLANGVEKYYWYDLVDDSTDANNHEGNFGMFYQEAQSVATAAPKPAAFTQALLIDQLGGRPAAGADDIGDGSFSFLFGDEADGVRVAWTLNGEATATYTASGPIEMTDASGAVTTLQPEDGQVTVPLTGEAVFLAGDFSTADEPEPTGTPSATPSPSETSARPEE